MRKLALILAVCLSCSTPVEVVRVVATPAPTRAPTPTPTESPQPPTAPTAAVTAEPPVYRSEGMEALIARLWPGDDAKAIAVARCESRLNPRAVGKAGERGLLQLHPRWQKQRAARLGYTWDQMFEPEPNLAVAWDLYREQGWRPWTCARKVGLA